MTEALRKGWCPGALRPMQAGDGLIVRVKPTCGILTTATAWALADLAGHHGNGKLDLTVHANLQLRGVREAALPTLLATLADLGLLDADADAEAVRNVVASPLAGLHAGLDIRPLVGALEARLAKTPALHALPGKFGFLVDDGSAPSLADVAADVRFDWTGETFAIGLGGTRADAVPVGACGADTLVDVAEAVGRGAVALFTRVPEARRMRDLVKHLGAPIVARIVIASRRRSNAGAAGRNLAECSSAAPGLLRCARNDGSASLQQATKMLALAPPYGRLDAGMLRLAADLAPDLAAGGEVRLTPWRSLLVPGAGSDERARARRAGFVVEPDDPRRAVAACVGAPDCSRATTATRADADALADIAIDLAAALGAAPRLHVSGCAKGCALAAAAPVTLVGRDGHYDLIRDGRAGDAPVQLGLDLAEVRAALEDLTSPAASAPPADPPPGSNRA